MVVYEKARMSKFNLLCFQIGCYCIVQTYIIQKKNNQIQLLKAPHVSWRWNSCISILNNPFNCSPIQKFNLFSLPLRPYLCVYIYIVKLPLPSDKKKFVLPILQFELEEERDQVINHVRFEKMVNGFKICCFSIPCTFGNGFNGRLHQRVEGMGLQEHIWRTTSQRASASFRTFSMPQQTQPLQSKWILSS